MERPVAGWTARHRAASHSVGIAKSHFVEWNGEAVLSLKTGFVSGVRLVGLDITIGNVTPHLKVYSDEVVDAGWRPHAGSGWVSWNEQKDVARNLRPT